MSDTPRTEAEVNRAPCPMDIVTVSADFACQLERELAAANERIRKMEEALDLCDAAFTRFSPLNESRYGDCWEAVRAALDRPNPHQEEDRP